MGLVRYAGGVGEISGSIAGNTFARNRSGFYVRHRTKPVNPNTGLQVLVRACVTFLTDRWSQTLTAAQRAAWDLYASNVAMKNRLGETIHLTGFNHFIRSNSNLKRRARTLVDAGPVVFELPAADPTFAITASEATQAFSVTFDNTMAWADENDAYMFIFGGKPQNAQRNFFGGPWRHAGYIAGVNGAPPVSPSNPGSVYGIAEGQRIWAYGRIIRVDGRTSEPFYADCFVGA